MIVHCRVLDEAFDFVRNVLDGACAVEIVRSAGLAPAVALALHDLAAEVRDVGVLDGLVQMHLRLHMVGA